MWLLVSRLGLLRILCNQSVGLPQRWETERAGWCEGINHFRMQARCASIIISASLVLFHQKHWAFGEADGFPSFSLSLPAFSSICRVVRPKHTLAELTFDQKHSQGFHKHDEMWSYYGASRPASLSHQYSSKYSYRVTEQVEQNLSIYPSNFGIFV